MDTADILPTITNMFGVSYNPEVSIGDDVFSDNHDNFVYFNDYSFIANGKHYQNISSSEDKKIQKYILKTKEKININSLVIIIKNSIEYTIFFCYNVLIVEKVLK